MNPIDAERTTPRVFISYSSHDAEAANTVADALEARGLACWIAPRDVPPGMRYGEAIIDGITACSLFVLVLSKRSNASPQVLAEVERAVSKGLSILTLRLEAVALTKSLEYFLSAFHWIDAFSMPPDAYLERLVEAVRQRPATVSIAPVPIASPVSDTLTFVFTDIEGSTKKWEEHPDVMREALEHHDALLRTAVEQHGGRIYRHLGDAFCAAFSDPSGAAAALAQAQQGLAQRTWEQIGPLRIRVAMHTGQAQARAGDYFGSPLNRVARLLGIAHAGQTLLSEATAALVGDVLPDGLVLKDLGHHRLKDLGRPERVFQLCPAGLPDAFPPLRSLDNPALPNNLPQQVSSFIGREKELGEVKALLMKSRLLTLTGPGGAGKTRLSLQVAADLLIGDADGVWLVELAPLTDPLLVPQAVAEVLGIRESAGRTLTKSLAEDLKEKRLLLILDNGEHLLAACASLAADLLRACPGVHLLASSREPLGVPGEQVYRVPSLSLPDPKQVQTAETLSQYESARLMIERAQAVRPDFAVTDQNADAVAQICLRLDGIPLAIELAAARVRSLSVEEVNTRLDNRFRILTGGSKTLLPRQQTLRALIDWSYDLLTDQEQTLLCRLSVFAGGWTLAAAETVCAGEGIEDWEVLDLLTALTDKSLAVVEPGGGATRYRLLESIRQYAGERLEERGAAAPIRMRHCDVFLALAETADSFLMGPDQMLWLSRLEVEHDNLRAALTWCEAETAAGAVATGRGAGLRLCEALWWFWDIRGHYSEGRQWLGRALEWTKEQPASALRARALNGAGTLAWCQADYTAACADYEESLAIMRRLGDTHGVANALCNLGLVALARDDYGAARVCSGESLALYREIGYQRGIAGALNNLAQAALHEGDLASARSLYGESLEIDRLLGHKQGVATSLGNLGEVAYVQGDYSAARGLFQESLDHSQRIGDRLGMVDALRGLAGVAACEGRIRQGVRLWGAADALRTQMGTPLSPKESARQEALADQARTDLGDEAFAGAFAAGRTLSWEQAVEEALEPHRD